MLVWNKTVGETQLNQDAPRSTKYAVVKIQWWSGGAVMMQRWSATYLDEELLAGALQPSLWKSDAEALLATELQ